jgi:hypothetical protein
MAAAGASMSEKIVYRCTKCEKVHEGLPAIAFDAPLPYYQLSEEDRVENAVLTDDLCGIAGEHWFVRAVLEVPVIGHREKLEWGVWGSLSEESFMLYRDSFEDDDQSRLGPMFSWFSSRLPEYPDTANLRCRVVPRDGRQRPLIEFPPDDEHALALDVRNGISLERAIAFVVPVLHKH